MADNRRRAQLVLNLAQHGLGSAYGAWRSPNIDGAAANDPDLVIKLAQLSEEAKLHSFFLADFLYLSPAAEFDIQERMDPIVLLSSVASRTSKIGLVATASTTYSHPYQLARQFATLDQVSGGRAGWNMVTTMSPVVAANFGVDEHPEHDERYVRAEEFVQVTKALWSSWEPDAFVRDRTSGIYLDMSKIHPINHDGKYYHVRGPLNSPPTPQGSPVLFQAGSSSAGIDFSAKHAEAIFTTQYSMDDSIEYLNQLYAAARAYGRKPSDFAVLPGLAPVVGRTTQAAVDIVNDYSNLMSGEAAMPLLRSVFGNLDLSVYPLDEPFPSDIREQLPPNAPISRAEVFIKMAADERLTLREVAGRIAISSGHRLIAGTADEIADNIEAWFMSGAADGFNLLPIALPDGIQDFVEHVVPRLQDRGIFQREYAGETFRERLGLSAK